MRYSVEFLHNENMTKLQHGIKLNRGNIQQKCFHFCCQAKVDLGEKSIVVGATHAYVDSNGTVKELVCGLEAELA
jgi:hypothetical protein